MLGKVLLQIHSIRFLKKKNLLFLHLIKLNISGIDERTNVKERLDTLLDNTAEDNINKLKTESKFESQNNQYKELNGNENVKKMMKIGKD